MTASPVKTFWLRKRGWALILYAVLLVLSHLTREPESFLPVDQASSDSVGILILLDPLSPSAPGLISLAEQLLAAGHRVRMPVLPGLNEVSRGHVRFSTLAEGLSVGSVPERVLANGQAGAVALHLAAQRQNRVTSLLLVDAAGVQEFALLGERHLNRVLYAASGLALSAADLLIPHFGLFPDLDLRRSQLKLFRESDRRALRPALEKIQQPVLLVETQMNPRAHSRNLEHERLLPQSSLLRIPLSNLNRAVEEMPHLSRMEAGLLRQLEAREAFDPADRPPLQGGALVLALLAIALGTLISEDATGVITGMMIANGNLPAVPGIAACIFGILAGDYLLYHAGRHWGRSALTRFPLRWMIDPLKLRETEEWFSRHAGKAILISRFVPGTRLPAYVAAGILGVPPRVFGLWFVLGAVIWSPLLVGISVLLSGHALDWIDRYQHAAPGLLVCGILLYLAVTHLLLPSFTWRGRRKLVGKWRRLTRPEYWPASLFYLPVTLQILLRAYRRGNRLLDFTVCNPCMPLSGLIEESKSEILDQVAMRSAVAPYVLLPETGSPDEQASRITAFLEHHSCGFPVVVKPDKGQRGVEVHICGSREEIDRILSLHRQDWILQKYIPGEEYGVFVILPPGEEPFVFGINGKRFPVVRGDGQRTLEDLILADERAVCQAGILLRAHADRLYTVPQLDEEVPLTRIGNHSRGTEFIECSGLETPELREAVVRIARSLPGFTLGRLDLRAPSREAFQQGKSLTVLEINGVTSESTNLYDRRYSYPQMVRILLHQWKWANQLGRQNRLQGAEPASLRELFRVLDQYHRRQKPV